MKDWMQYMGAAAGVFILAYMDLTTEKMPNKLTFPLMITGLLYHLLRGGVYGAVYSISGILTGFSIILLFLMGIMKAGDIKTYMGAGAWMGAGSCFLIFLWSILCGGICGVLIMAVRRNGRERMNRLWIYFCNLLMTRVFTPYVTEENGGRLRFGICIAAGTAVEIVRLTTGR